MYCKVCGTRINDDSTFCYSCGNKVEVVKAAQPQVNVPETNYNYVTSNVGTNPQGYNGYNQTNAQSTDYSYVTGNVGANQQNYNEYNQVIYAQNPSVPHEIKELQNKIFTTGLISAIFSETGILSIVAIILGAIAGKNAKKLKGMGYRLKGKAKAGEILGKVGLIMGIVITVFWVFYFGILFLALLGFYTMEGGGGFNI